MEQRETPLADAAAAFLADARITPFTTPGHKRAPHLADDLLRLDVPLFSGAEDLHQRSGVLASAERLAAQLWEADLCRFCVNGSTQGNHALALALARPGDTVLVSRNLHKSLFAGLVLAGLHPSWIRPAVDSATALPLALTTADVEDALRLRPDARAILLVEPSYVGVVSDLPAISKLARRAGMPLVVDAAWGAHFGFHPELPPHALAAGADALVASAHKTLAAFTQGAYLIARRERLDLGRLEETFELVHTTSPSAAILASLDRARQLLALHGRELLGRTIVLARSFRERVRDAEGVLLASDDPTKLVLSLAETGADGLAVEADLLAEGIRLELANRDTLVALLTIGDSETSVEKLAGALLRSLARRGGNPRAPGAASAVWSIQPEQALSPREAFFATRETVAAERAPGRIAAETVAPYPPGIPAIAPGEVVSSELVGALREAARQGTRLAYCADPALATIQVVA